MSTLWIVLGSYAAGVLSLVAAAWIGETIASHEAGTNATVNGYRPCPGCSVPLVPGVTTTHYPGCRYAVAAQESESRVG